MASKRRNIFGKKNISDVPMKMAREGAKELIEGLGIVTDYGGGAARVVGELRPPPIQKRDSRLPASERSQPAGGVEARISGQGSARERWRVVRASCEKMLKTGRSGGDQAAPPSPIETTTTAQTHDRPRKKLSFREPEIMGYYMQMKQNVASRLSRKGRHPNKHPPAAEEPLVKRSDSAEDLELESKCRTGFTGVGLKDDLIVTINRNRFGKTNSE
ncbi:hypothetical protein AAG570_012125 [Ranatra chinensis]|uniref:Uncharacterized protein n=1 Tax=Ranatra chinensis TaxID=642074 RepID=A0ABD0YIA7_9HEMI